MIDNQTEKPTCVYLDNTWIGSFCTDPNIEMSAYIEYSSKTSIETSSKTYIGDWNWQVDYCAKYWTETFQLNHNTTRTIYHQGCSI